MTLTAALIVLFVCSIPAGFSSSRDPAYVRAHAAAVKYRRARDDVQRRLTRRVLEVRSLRSTLGHRSDVLEAIRLAAVTWHVDYGMLLRRARCESVLDPNARNRWSGASGLFQFLPSTFRSTPYARESVWSPYSNAMAAAWMSSHGRDGEWVCRG